MSRLLAKTLNLSYDSAVATKSSVLKTYYRSVRLIKDDDYVNPELPSYITQVLLCGNCVDPETRNLYVFYIDTSVFGSAWIIEFNIDSRRSNVVYYDKYNNIGFDPHYKIYNSRVVHGRLIWTDNKNPIYQMDIVRAKKSFSLKIGYGQFPNTEEWKAIKTYSMDQVVSNGNRFYKSLVYNNLGNEPRYDSLNWLDLKCLIEDAYYSMNIENFYFAPMPPTYPPEVMYQADDSRKINNLRQTLFQFAYRYVYMDWRKSTFSPASIVPVPQAEEETATGLASEQISLNNKFQIVVNSGGEEVRAVEVIGRSSADPSKWYLIETLSKFEEQERGNEISRTAEPELTKLTMTIPVPIVMGTNIVNADKVMPGLWVFWPEVMNTYVSSEVVGMQWTNDEFGQGSARTTTISCNPINATIISKPEWVTILSESGYSLLVGMTVHNREVISVFPNERPQNNMSGYIVLRNVYTDSVTVITVQAGATPPVMIPIIPIMAIDPFDSSAMVIIGSSCGATSNSADISYSLVVNHPAYATGEAFDLYWRTIVTRGGVQISMGNGVLPGILDEVSNTGTLVLDANLNEDDTVVIYLSAQSFLEKITSKMNVGMAILTPEPPINSWIASEKSGMSWLASESGVANAITSLITAPPMNCHITSFPDWITIQGVAGYNLYAGWTIQNGETISVFPTENNIGSPRSGYIVLTNYYGDSATIIVSQADSVSPPTGVPVSATIQRYAGDTSGLSIAGSAAYALSGNKNVLWSALIEHTAHAEETWTMYWRLAINGVIQGSGSFDVYVGSNSGELVTDTTLLAGDVVLIDFSSVTF